MTHCAHDRRRPIRDRWDGLEARSQIAARPRSRHTGPRPPTARLARGHASTARGRSPVLPRHDFAHWLERGPGRPPGPRSTTAPEHRTPTSTRHGPSNTAAGCHHPAGSAPSGIAEFYCSSPEPSGRRAQQFQPLTLFGAQVDSELPAVKFLVHAREDRWLRVSCRCPIPAIVRPGW